MPCSYLRMVNTCWCARKETTNPVPVLLKWPDPPPILKKKLSSLDSGRSSREAEKSAKQKPSTSAIEQAWAVAANVRGEAAVAAVKMRHVAGTFGSSRGLETTMPRRSNSTMMNSPKSPLVSVEVFMASNDQ